MARMERLYRYTDRPMSWTKAILLGLGIWVLAVLFLGQVPSYMIYWADQNIDMLIEWSKSVPGVNPNGLNTIQIQIIRDIAANTVQMGLLVGALLFVYKWQESKRKRIGGKGPQDTVKGYMPGK